MISRNHRKSKITISIFLRFGEDNKGFVWSALSRPQHPWFSFFIPWLSPSTKIWCTKSRVKQWFPCTETLAWKDRRSLLLEKAPEKNSRNERKGREGRGQRQQRKQRGTQHGIFSKTLGSAHYYCCYCWQCATRKSYHATSSLVKLGKHAPGFTPRILKCSHVESPRELFSGCLVEELNRIRNCLCVHLNKFLNWTVTSSPIRVLAHDLTSPSQNAKRPRPRYTLVFRALV